MKSFFLPRGSVFYLKKKEVWGPPVSISAHSAHDGLKEQVLSKQNKKIISDYRN
jgi:hypothetical protein